MQQLTESRRMILAHKQTRKEVANLLHSQVQGRLLVLGYWLKDCEEHLQDAPREVVERLGSARNMLVEIIDQDLRSITRYLYPSIIRVGLPGALNSLAERFQGVFNVELNIDDQFAAIERCNCPGLGDEMRLILYRIVEEALTNVAKHSGADRARISLGLSSSTEIYLEIEDNSRGVDPAKVSPGCGLLNMKEYAEALDGRLEVEAFSGWSTAVKVWLPVPNREGLPV